MFLSSAVNGPCSSVRYLTVNVYWNTCQRVVNDRWILPFSRWNLQKIAGSAAVGARVRQVDSGPLEIVIMMRKIGYSPTHLGPQGTPTTPSELRFATRVVHLPVNSGCWFPWFLACGADIASIYPPCLTESHERLSTSLALHGKCRFNGVSMTRKNHYWEHDLFLNLHTGQMWVFLLLLLSEEWTAMFVEQLATTTLQDVSWGVDFL